MLPSADPAWLDILRRDDAGALRALLDKDGRPETPPNNNELIAIASEQESTACLAVLLKHSPTPKDVVAVFVRAAAMGRGAVCRTLVAGGADPTAATAGLLITPLVSAAGGGRSALCRWLIGLGADPNHRTRQGGTALIVAASHHHADTCGVLLEAGADIAAVNSGGATALHVAAARWNAAVPGAQERAVIVLLEAGIDPQARNNADATAADLAAPHIAALINDFQRAHADWLVLTRVASATAPPAPRKKKM